MLGKKNNVLNKNEVRKILHLINPEPERSEEMKDLSKSRINGLQIK